MNALPIKAFLALLALGAALPSAAQGPIDNAEKVKQVIVYGNDPCPVSSGDEIQVCARMQERDRYRIPPELRTDPNDPKVQSWLNRAEAIEYVGKEGTNSCSPTGGGGFTGCFQKLARAARVERKALMGDASWADLVSAEREKRLSGLDAESAEVEARVKAEEAREAQKRVQQGGAATGN